MLARLTTAAIVGVDAVPVSVEVDVSSGGLPGLVMVGLPDATVRESRDRVRTAIRNAGFPVPSTRITVSLAPSDMRKVGASFDLPIALGILAASGVLPHHADRPLVVVGGLSLDGGVPAMRGVLPIAAMAGRTRAALVFPDGNLSEAGIVEGLPLHPVRSLLDAARVLVSPARRPVAAPPPSSPETDGVEDLADVRGQPIGRRALEIAASGAHHLIFSGPPGAGKTMLASRLAGLLPPLLFDEALAVTAIHSIAGVLPARAGLMTRRPFRAPHHTCSEVALIGGGSVPRPGEISLAHQGVLFLDELPEFTQRALDTLRQPLEQGVVHVARAARAVAFPAKVMLVAAMNPCPCGYAGSPARPCVCSTAAIDRYRSRPSGPLLDRFDLLVELPAVPWSEIAAEDPAAEDSAVVRSRVVEARRRQLERQSVLNSELTGSRLRQNCQPDSTAGVRLLQRGVEKFGLSVRGVSRVLKVARTIADMEGASRVGEPHVAEALHFRLAARPSNGQAGYEFGDRTHSV